MRIWLVLFLVAILAGCGGHSHRTASPPIRGREWRAVVRDWLADDRIDHPHSCGALVVARIQADAYTDMNVNAIEPALARAERSGCTMHGKPFAVRVGMSDREVAQIAGAPVASLSGPRCWFYRATRSGTSIDGARFCFVRGRVSNVKTSVHL